MRFELLDLVVNDKVIPKTSGVYFIYGRDDEIIYIGSSIQLQKRLYLKRIVDSFLKFSLSHILILEYPKEIIRDTESALIAWFKPEVNKYKMNGNYYSELKKFFREPI